MSTQVGSLSVSGSVNVTQSMILRAPVLVVARLGWSSVMPESTMPTTTPRPSHAGCAATNCGDPTSRVGIYALVVGVSGPGGSTFTGSAAGSGLGMINGMVSSTLTA